MPIIKSAKKKLRKDRKREIQNDKIRKNLKSLVKAARQTPSASSLQKVFSALDKAVKVNLIHSNKSGRLKSRLSKLLTTGPASKSQAKKTTKKSPTKKK